MNKKDQKQVLICEDFAEKIKQAATKSSQVMSVEEAKAWLAQFKGN